MKKIAMVVGEDFWLRIPMNNESAGRHLCMDDVEVIHAWLESGYGGCWTLPLETDGEQLEGVAVKVPGSRLGLGTYAVVMAGKFVNGGHFRTKRQLFIRLVDREEQADAKPTMFNEEKAYWAGPAVLSGMLSRDGLNTYELAVLHGYDGTLEQFLAQAGIELQDFMVTKAKLSREVQTLLDKGAEKGITPMGAYSSIVKYRVNDMVYDATTNSSYISLFSENRGHAVTDTNWWKKTFDGNYVLNAIMTAAQQTLNEAKAATEQATADAIAATEDAISATEEAIAAKNAANAVAAQKVAQAQIGYYECNSLATDATKVTTSGTIGTDSYVITENGGQMKIRMDKANSVDSNVKLQIGNTTALPLYYNGLPASSDNSWEEGEVLSVYYYNNKYWASNSQGGGGKAVKINCDNSQSGLTAENVQWALDELGQREIIFDGSNKINYYANKLGFVIISDEEVIWISNSNKQEHKAIPVNGEKYVKITAGENKAYIAFATSSYTTPTSSSHHEPVPVCDGTGRYSVPANGFKIFPIPDDCAYILIDITSDNNTFYTPQSVYLGYNLGSLANNIPNKIPFATFEHLALRITDNQEIAIQSRNVTDYIDISSMSNIIYTRACSSGAGGDYGMLFYNENKVPISGHKELVNQAVSCYVIEKISVPDGAIYARFTYWNDERLGKFFVTDGDRDAEATALWQSKKDSDVLTGYEAGVYRQMDGTTDNGFQLNSLYGLGSMIPVAKGDTVLWHYGEAGIRTMALCIYDEEGQFVTTYNNNVAYERIITNFMNAGELSQYYVRASMLIANGSDNYLEVNGERVWTAVTDTVGNRLNKLDKAVFQDTDLTFYNRFINTSTGVEAETTQRLSTSFIEHRGRLIISVGEGYLIRSVNYYDENKTWYKGTLYQTQSVITEQQEKPCYIKLVITNTDDTTDIAIDAPINLTFNTYSGGSLDEFDDALRIGTFNSSYNNTDVETVKLKFCGLLNGKNNIENFLLFSDPHLSANSRYESMNEQIRDKYISTLQKYYNSLPLDNCICAGDLLNYHDTNAEALDELGYFDGYMRKLFRNYRPCFGNHDTAPYYDVSNPKMRNTTLVRTDIRNVLFREEKNTYYSFDGINTKFYVLNSGSSYIKPMSGNTNEPTINNIRWEQVDWFANKLLSDDASYSVILMHMYSNGTPLTWYEESMEKYSAGVFPFSKNIREVAIAYNNRSTITKNGLTYDFSACTGKVTVFLCGHSHVDFIDDSMELPVVCITNLEGGVWNAETEEVEYALVPTFDCCMNDLDNSALYMTRVGAGVSRIVNYSHKAVSVGGSISLTCKLSGTITWQTRNSSIATVSNGTVAGVSSGCTGIIATNENGEEEYWIVKVG